jgi:hypothetical protein
LKDIEVIKEQISKGNYELTAHALKVAIERRIMYYEIEQAATNAVIIEDYPDDKYSSSVYYLDLLNY